MAENTEKEADLAVVEAQDGSATVDLPENLLDTGEDEAGQPQIVTKNEGGEVKGEDEDHPDDSEELRQAKRNRRKAKKELIRKTNQEKDAKLIALQRRNEELERRMAQLERNSKAANVVRVEKDLDDAQIKLEWAKQQLASAASSGDGNALVEAQMYLNNTQDEVKQLQAMKIKMEREAKRPQPQNDLVDPEIQRLATQWMRRNPWYNPQANDADSRIAKKVDELMAAEGWSPSDPDYWDELDTRLQEKLPHRYNDSNDDEIRQVRRPRNVVGSSGREASAAYGGVARNQFVLSPERVKAMKEAGAWDNPERKAKMIKNFIAFDRANNRN